MKKYYKTLLCLTLCLILSLTGCTYYAESVENELTSNEHATVMGITYDDEQTAVTDVIPIPGEEFSLSCTYDTGDYLLKDWRVTSNKTINMTVNTVNLPEGYTVHIEHVHADIVLKSTEPQIDGITQDSMDDSDHRVPTKGFPISDTISYNNIFAIEGYTDQFYKLWGYAFGSYGNVSSSYQRLTEGNIRNAGGYAEKLIVIYDIVITPPDSEEGYVKSVCSEVLIPLVSEITYVEKDFITNETISNETTSTTEQ